MHERKNTNLTGRKTRSRKSKQSTEQRLLIKCPRDTGAQAINLLLSAQSKQPIKSSRTWVIRLILLVLESRPPPPASTFSPPKNKQCRMAVSYTACPPNAPLLLQVIQLGRFLFASSCTRPSTLKLVTGESVSYTFSKMTISIRLPSAVPPLRCRIVCEREEEGSTPWL